MIRAVRIACFIIALNTIVPFVAAGELQLTLDFPLSGLKLEKAGEYWMVSYPDCENSSRVGAPQLPLMPVCICLPAGTIPRAVTIISETNEEVPGSYLILPRQNNRLDAPIVPPDREIYQSDTGYPVTRIESLSWGDLGGYRIASFIVNPVEYIPTRQTLSMCTHLKLSINWEEGVNQRSAVKPTEQRSYSEVRSLVKNPDDVQVFYPPEVHLKTLAPLAEYLIITHPSFQSEFLTLAAHKETKGFTTSVITTDWISGHYTGEDTQAKIRDCLIDYYQNRGTRWVLMGGGINFVPMRLAYQPTCLGSYVATDLYFACLDGNWNADSDAYYGELQDKPDTWPELVVGRAPVDTPEEARTFVQKVIAHETGQSCLRKALLLSQDFGLQESENLKVLFPPGWQITSLYDGGAAYGAAQVTREATRAALRDGYGYINHIGHGSPTSLYLSTSGERLLYTDFDSLTNGPDSVLVSDGCLTAYPYDDNLPRHFLLNPLGGGIAYIGNTGGGLVVEPIIDYIPEGMFKNGLYRPGSALEYYRLRLAPITNYSDTFLYAAISMNLFGDPETPYAQQIIFTPALDDSLGGDGDGWLEPGESACIIVTVNNFWRNAENLTLTISSTAPYLEISRAQSCLGNVAYGSSQNNSATPFQIAMSPDALNDCEAELLVQISSANGYSQTEYYRILPPRYVDWRNQTGLADGTKAHPYSTIQKGIACSSAGDVLLVAPGTYRENIRPKIPLLVKGDSSHTTIIDGGNAGPTIILDSLPSFALENLTVTHGLADYDDNYFGGGGIFGWYSRNISISHCAIADNWAHTNGGGICLYGTRANISDCLITGNRAVLPDEVWGSSSGGGIYLYDSGGSTLTRNIIAFNESNFGGGVCIHKCSAAIEHCDITLNGVTPCSRNQTRDGAGIHLISGDTLIQNSIVSDNYYFGISCDTGQNHYILRYSALGNNTPGDIHVDPVYYQVVNSLYADPELNDPQRRDFRLKSTSPCIDTAENIGGWYWGNGPDIGAIEYISSVPSATPTATPPELRTPTPTPSPVVSRTASPTPTPTPSASLAPTATPTPVPSPSPSRSPRITTTPTCLCTPTPTPAVVPIPRYRVIESGDYDGDGAADISIFRPSAQRWSVRNVTRVYFSASSDAPASADYNGDGTAEIAAFRDSTGLWSVRDLTRFCLGSTYDQPVPGDYNGDGTAGAGIFRETSGLWSIRNLTRIYFGSFSDTVIPGYYDHDDNKDIAIFRGSTGMWSVRNLTRFYFGSSTDDLVPGDYSGAGYWKAGIFRGASGLWSIRNVTRFYAGNSTDWSLPGDYDGDGSADAGIFRDSTGLWSVRDLTRVYFGSTGDIPVTR